MLLKRQVNHQFCNHKSARYGLQFARFDASEASSSGLQTHVGGHHPTHYHCRSYPCCKSYDAIRRQSGHGCAVRITAVLSPA